MHQGGGAILLYYNVSCVSYESWSIFHSTSYTGMEMEFIILANFEIWGYLAALCCNTQTVLALILDLEKYVGLEIEVSISSHGTRQFITIVVRSLYWYILSCMNKY